MRIAFFRNFAGAGVCVLLVATIAPAQNPASDSSAYSVQKLDSTQIRGLPLSRDAEVTSFLPRTWLRFGYDARVRGAIGGSDVRVDGVPVNNLSLGGSLFEMPADLLQAVTVHANGTPVSFDRPTALQYFTAPANAEWSGHARTRTDVGLPGSIGGFRGDAKFAGGIGRTRLNFALSAQSAQSTEFNNVGDVTFYDVTWVDTTITLTDSNGAPRSVAIPGFDEVDDGNLIPGTNWNQILAGGRFDFLTNARTQAYATFHLSRLQQLQFPGLHVFNLQGQVADRSTSLLTSLAFDHSFSPSSRLRVRLARGRDETIHGVLTEAFAQNVRASGAGPQLGSFEFLIDDDDYAIGDDRIADFITNSFAPPFAPSRTDLRARNEFSFNPYATFSFSTSGITSTEYQFSSENRWFVAASMEHRRGQHSLTAGAEATHSPTRFISTPYLDASSIEAWVEAPTHLRAFVQDRLNVGRGIVEAGVRIDSYESGARYPETPGYAVEDEYFEAPRQTALSPRLAFAFPFERVTVRGFAGAGAHIPSFYEQFSGIHKDYFRFANASTNELFSRPVSLVKQTYFGAEGDYAITSHFTVAGSFYRAHSSNELVTRKQPFDDPLNPGSVTYLNVTSPTGELTNTAIDLMAMYRAAQRSAWFGISRINTENLHSELQSGPAGPFVTQFEGLSKATSILAAVTTAGPRMPWLQDVEVTASVRAISPLETLGLDGEVVFESPWNIRFDTRLAKPVSFGGMRGKLWLDALRLAGSSVFSDPTVNEFRIAAHRQTLGGGQMNDQISLRSVQEAGFGVRNDVDLYMLRRAEARFGNGDLIFTAEEQNAAFAEEARFESISNALRTQDRRLVVGVELAF